MPVLTKDDITTKLNTICPTQRVTTDQADVSPDQDAMDQCYQYQIRVRKQGCYVATHLVKAVDALSAINHVELLYGGPVILTDGAIEDKDGTRHHIVVANNWHGYTYQAKKI